MVTPSQKIWMDGKFVDWNDASVHILTHSLHYGLAAFEGIRCYEGELGSAIFRLQEHVDRLFESAHITMMQVPFTKKEVHDAIIETVRVNDLKSCYIRPIIYIGYGEMGVYPGENPIRLAIAAWPWGTYLGKDALSEGIRAKISSFTRHHVNITMCKAKANGNYINSMLALNEALSGGADEALLLDNEGYVAEGSGENIFVIKDKVLYTPELTSCLDGITRKTIIQLAEERGYAVREKRITRDEIYVADEAFFTGTAAEVTPIRELDGRILGEGKRGPITEQLQAVYFDLVRGKLDDDYGDWLTYVS